MSKRMTNGRCRASIYMDPQGPVSARHKAATFECHREQNHERLTVMVDGLEPDDHVTNSDGGRYVWKLPAEQNPWDLNHPDLDIVPLDVSNMVSSIPADPIEAAKARQRGLDAMQSDT